MGIIGNHRDLFVIVGEHYFCLSCPWGCGAYGVYGAYRMIRIYGNYGDHVACRIHSNYGAYVVYLTHGAYGAYGA